MLFAEILKIAVQIAAVVIGWIIVHKFSIARDRDKARREMVSKAADSLTDEITKLVSSATVYHLASRDTSKENELKTVLQDFSTRASLLSLISDDNSELAALRSSVIGLRKAITGEHFEDEHAAPLSQNSIQVQSIAEAALRAKEKLTKLKYCQFSVLIGKV
jgi:hypothetical protein